MYLDASPTEYSTRALNKGLTLPAVEYVSGNPTT